MTKEGATTSGVAEFERKQAEIGRLYQALIKRGWRLRVIELPPSQGKAQWAIGWDRHRR